MKKREGIKMVRATKRQVLALTCVLVAVVSLTMTDATKHGIAGAFAAGFAVRQDFTTGSNPRSVTMGGVNGNGKLGSAVAIDQSNSVSVLLNTITVDIGASEAAAPPPPTVSSIVRANSNPTNLNSVNFTVTFSQGVTGVDPADFVRTTTGVAGGSISSVTPVDSSHYTVAVNTGTGSGTIRLDVSDDDSIKDGSNQPLGGAGPGNGDFTSGEVYTVDKIAPSVTINQAVSQLDPASGSK